MASFATAVKRPQATSMQMVIVPETETKKISMYESSVFISTVSYVRMFDVGDEQAQYIHHFANRSSIYNGLDVHLIEAIRSNAAVGVSKNGLLFVITGRAINVLTTFETPHAISRISVNKLAIASHGWLTQLDIATGKEYAELSIDGNTRVLALQSHGQNEIVGSTTNGGVCMWDIRQPTACWDAADQSSPYTLLHTSNTCIYGANQDAVVIWDVRKASTPVTQTRLIGSTSMCTSGHSQLIVTTSRQSIYTFHNLTNLKQGIETIFRRYACVPRFTGIHDKLMYVICESRAQLAVSPLLGVPPTES